MSRSLDVVSHWHHSVEGFNTSALEFFKAIEVTLTAKDAPVRPERVEYLEGGILSAKREYLRVSYGRYCFDIAAFPFGRDFYFSWWQGQRSPNAAFGCLAIVALPVAFMTLIAWAGIVKGTLLFFIGVGIATFALMQQAGAGDSDVAEAFTALPYVGPIFAKLFRPVTYYSEDSRIMFEETVHRVVLTHVGTLLSVAKLPPLSPDDDKVERRRTLL